MLALWHDGYEANSLKALSEKLGITRSSFYNTFGSRDDLFKEVVGRYFEQAPDLPLALADKDQKLRPLLTTTFREICRVRASDQFPCGCLVVNSAAELCGAHPQLGPFLSQLLEQSMNRYVVLVTWAVERGELPQDTDVRAKALAINGLLLGINLMAKFLRSETDLWRTAQTTLRALDLYEAVDD